MEIDFNLAFKFKELIINSYNEARNINDINIQNKELNDIVTDVDLFMERKIVNAIQEWFPNHSINSEECGNISKSSEFEWLIDPIDGTINYSKGLPMYSTTIALRKNGETIFGIIYDYTSDRFYYAIKNQGAYCNGEKIHVSSKSELSESVISFCLTSHYNIEKINEVLEVQKSLAPKVRGLRLIVSSAIELAWCAEGKIDGCLNVKESYRLGSSAGILLVEEAGGMATNIKGKTREKYDTMLVTNGLIHSKLVNAMKYVTFVGNITEVIEINSDNIQNPIKKYIAGKAYSEALSASKEGLNCKILTVMSGLRKNECNSIIADLKNNNIDTSYIEVSNDIDNDIKIVFKDENNNKIREEDILNGSAEALTEDIIIQNEELIKNSSYVVCQTKMNKNSIKKLVQICDRNDVPLIIVPSRPKEISIIDNSENKEIIEKASLIICDTNELKEIFGQDVDYEIILKQYPNKLILINDNVKYYNGNDYVLINSENINFNEVGAKDIFVGKFVYSLTQGWD